MRSQLKAGALALAIFLIGPHQVVAQVSATGNNPPGGSYVGHMGTNTNPVEVRHNGNYPIQFYTDSIQRMRLYETRLNTTIQSHSVNQSGYVGISNQPLFFTSTVGPFSRLHLVDSCNNNQNHFAQQYGFRPWMKNGITFTGNQDQSYVGQKYAGTTVANDSTDMVIQWSDNDDDSPWPTDRLRFLFTDDYNDANPPPYGARSMEGLESFRIFVPNDTSAFVGVGDFHRATFYNGGTMVDPTERLDVLNGRTRIRQLPTDPSANALTKVMVVDDTPGANFGVVKWRDVSTIAAPPDCDWEVTGADHVVTAYLAGPLVGCPDQSNNVGIGNNAPFAKLDIVRSVNAGGATSTGVNVRMGTSSTNNIGGNSDAQSAATGLNLGWRGSARNGARNWGLDGNAAVNSLDSTVLWVTPRVVGVRGFADGNFLTTPSQTRGVWGISRRPSAGGWGFGGWFDGFTYCSLGAWTGSDAALKEDVEPLQEPLTVIGQLQPKSYKFKHADYPSLALDDKTHYGLIAQDVEAVLPALVMDVEQPAVVDSVGNVLIAEVPFKIMNYEGLIPWLIAGMNAQQAQITDLQQQLSSCCAADGTRMQQGTGIRYIDNALQPAAQATDALAKDDLVVIPNPFQENPTISYRIGTTGRAQLRVSSSEGRDMGLLFDAGMQAGQHTLVWNTTGMAAGTYWLTLTLDGVRITEQAVKVQ